ncbi:MAG: DUF2029 domain-containing protein [Cytophagales bacterium]|nr:DUF2029 domain-containing protein [Cytophagales bacterium]
MYSTNFQITKFSNYLTKFLNDAGDKFALFISKPSNLDGRIILLLFISFYFIAIYVSSFFMDYDKFWLYLGVFKAETLFMDLNYIISVLDCSSKGYDVLSPNPCTPYHGYFSYPRIWLLFSNLHVSTDSTVGIAIGIITIFYSSIFWLVGRLNINEGIYYGLIMCSPPIMLAVKYCHPDIYIFILCALAVLVVKKKYPAFWAYTFLMLASFLKLYPFATIIAFFNEKKKPSLIAFFILLSIGIIYIFLNLQDIIYISHNLQEKFWSKYVVAEYGCLVLFDFLNYYPFFHYIFSVIPAKIISYTIVAILIFTLIYIIKNQKLNSDLIMGTVQKHLFNFKISASIYIGTFLIGNNYDYKFMFLIFAIPQLLAWVKYNNEIRTITMLVLAGIIITIWSTVLFSKFYFFVWIFIEELINWYIFAYVIYMMIHISPLWARRMLLLSKK